MNLDFCLQSAGNLKDSPSGRRKYAEYLFWLAEDEPSRKAMQFERMSKGWILGSREFKTELLKEEKHIKSGLALGVDEVKEIRQIVWETKVEQCIEVMKENLKVAIVEKKSADWKIAIAGVLKQKYLCGNGWQIGRLEMGKGSSVSRYVGEMLRGERLGAKKLYDSLLNAIVDDGCFISLMIGNLFLGVSPGGGEAVDVQNAGSGRDCGLVRIRNLKILRLTPSTVPQIYTNYKA